MEMSNENFSSPPNDLNNEQSPVSNIPNGQIDADNSSFISNYPENETTVSNDDASNLFSGQQDDISNYENLPNEASENLQPADFLSSNPNSNDNAAADLFGGSSTENMFDVVVNESQNSAIPESQLSQNYSPQNGELEYHNDNASSLFSTPQEISATIPEQPNYENSNYSPFLRGVVQSNDVHHGNMHDAQNAADASSAQAYADSQYQQDVQNYGYTQELNPAHDSNIQQQEFQMPPSAPDTQQQFQQAAPGYADIQYVQNQEQQYHEHPMQQQQQPPMNYQQFQGAPYGQYGQYYPPQMQQQYFSPPSSQGDQNQYYSQQHQAQPYPGQYAPPQPQHQPQQYPPYGQPPPYNPYAPPNQYQQPYPQTPPYNQYQQLPSQQLPSQQLPSQQLPSQQLPSQQLPSQQLPSQQLPSQQLPSQQLVVQLQHQQYTPPPPAASSSNVVTPPPSAIVSQSQQPANQSSIYTPLQPGNNVSSEKQPQKRAVFIPQGAQEDTGRNSPGYRKPASPRGGTPVSPPRNAPPPATTVQSGQRPGGGNRPVIIAPNIPGMPQQQIQVQANPTAQQPNVQPHQNRFTPPPQKPTVVIPPANPMHPNPQQEQPQKKYTPPPNMPNATPYIPGLGQQPNVQQQNVQQSKLSEKKADAPHFQMPPPMGKSGSVQFHAPPPIPNVQIAKPPAYVPGMINKDNENKQESKSSNELQNGPKPYIPGQNTNPYIPGISHTKEPENNEQMRNSIKDTTAPYIPGVTHIPVESNEDPKPESKTVPDINVTANIPLDTSQNNSAPKFQKPPAFQPPPQFQMPPAVPEIKAPHFTQKSETKNQETKIEKKDENSRGPTFYPTQKSDSSSNGPSVFTPTKTDSTENQENEPFIKELKPVTALGFGGLFLKVKDNESYLDSLFNRVNDSQIKNANKFECNKDFISSMIENETDQGLKVLWASASVSLSHKGPIDPTTFRKNLRIDGTPEQNLLNLLSQPVNTKDEENNGKENQNDANENNESENSENTFNAIKIGQENLNELMNLIESKDEEKALEYAIKNEMWTFALILSNFVSIEEQKRTTSLFIQKTLPESSKLSKTLHSIASTSEILPTEETWQKDLFSLLSFFSHTQKQNLLKFAESLEKITNQSITLKAVSVACRILSATTKSELSSIFIERKSITEIQIHEILNKVFNSPKEETIFNTHYASLLTDLGFTTEAISQLNNNSVFAEKLLNDIETLSKQIKEDSEIKIVKIQPEEEKPKQNEEKQQNAPVFIPMKPTTQNQTLANKQQQDVPLMQTKGPAFTPLQPPSFDNNDFQDDSFESNHQNLEIQSNPPQNPPKQTLKPQNQQKQNKQPQQSQPQQIQKGEQQKKGWISGFISKLNPFSRTQVVDLSQHDEGEMVWNGHRYVMKGHENDDDQKQNLPPPPPKGLAPSASNQPPPSTTAINGSVPPPPPGIGGVPPPVPCSTAAPPPTSTVSGRLRASNRYVANF